MTLQDTPVLIVGAGPAGLVTAAALAHGGVASLVIDRRTAPSTLPRATTISTRTMEIFRSWGLEDAIRSGGPDVEWLLWRCETLARVADGVGVAVGMPTAEQSALVSPTAPACAPQDHLESVVEAHLAGLPGARVERGVELVALDVHPGGAAATLRDVATGAERVVHARYVVAADGSRSFTRRALGIAMHGPERLVDGVTSLFRAPLWDVVGEHRYGIYGVGGPEGGAFLPAGRDDRWGYGYLRAPGTPPPSDEELA
ncbi:MAG TPA: FAD-dependent monooxygenase, partial [Solirubrobacteraceae bacterium]